MTSTLSWLAYDDSERRKTLDLLDALGQRDTRDELGLSPIRDAFADLLFPGLSTIQTRARYLLFVPWIYLAVEEKRSSQLAARRAREAEVRLVDVLAEEEGERSGVIGFRSRKNLQRLPSSIYWEGLGRFRIRHFDGSLDQLHRALDAGLTHDPHSPPTEDEDIGLKRHHHWDPNLPPAPEEFPEGTSFSLSYQEAHYLRDRIRTFARVAFPPRPSYLAFLVTHAKPKEKADFPWDHPAATQAPEPVLEELHHARLFSLVMHGASLLYHLMLAQLQENADNEASLVDGLSEWMEDVAHQESDLTVWNLGDLWRVAAAGGASLPLAAQAFVRQWVSFVMAKNKRHQGVHEDSQIRLLIQERERSLKGDARARLVSPEARANWEGLGGPRRMDYRWSTARTVVKDILEGLREATRA